MSCSTLPIIVAGLSIFIHFILTIITTFDIIFVIKRRNATDYGDDSSFFSNGGVMLILLVISIILEVAVLVSSIYLVFGILKNHRSYITVWLYLTVAYLILSFADFVGGYNALGYLFPIKLVVFILHIAMWYPIFKFWRDLSSLGNTTAAQDKGEKVESSIYPQLEDVDHTGQIKAEEQEKHHAYSSLS